MVRIHELIGGKQSLYVVMQYCEGGSLRSLIKSSTNEQLSEELVVQLARHLWSALTVLNDRNIIHRFIKPDNILIQHDSDGNLNFVLSDYGYSHYLDKEEYAMAVGRSALYVAPEVALHEKHTNQADLWSIGIVLYRALLGSFPYVDVKGHIQFVLRRDKKKEKLKLVEK